MELMIGRRRITIEDALQTDAALADAYTKAAQSWDASLRRLGYHHAYVRLFKRLRREGVLARLPATPHLLDCGIGSGALTRALLQQISVDAQITGVDVAIGMVEEARRLFTLAGRSARLYRQDIRCLEFADAQFDLVMTAHTLEHLPDAHEGLREMARVLRPGAPLIVIMTRRDVMSDWLCLKWPITRMTSIDLMTLMRDVGLERVRVTALDGPWWCGRMSIVGVGMKPG